MTNDELKAFMRKSMRDRRKEMTNAEWTMCNLLAEIALRLPETTSTFPRPDLEPTHAAPMMGPGSG